MFYIPCGLTSHRLIPVFFFTPEPEGFEVDSCLLCLTKC
jgi:hypothetical protein